VSNRGRPPAATDAENRNALRRLFLRRYDDDDEFTQELTQLVPTAEAAGLGTISIGAVPQFFESALPSAELQEFRTAVAGLAASFGLDRLGDAGRNQVVAWCRRYIAARRSGSFHPSTYDARRFSSATIPAQYEGETVGVITPPWQEESWELTRERRADVSRRLERRARDHIQATLDRIEAEARSQGLVFPDTSPRLDRDLDWLYRKVRHGETYQAIFDSLRPPPKGGVDSVRQTVRRIATKVGVDQHGWEAGWR
jgi:hypothetical protein